MEHAQHKNAPGSSSSRPSTTTTTTTSASAGSLAQYRPSAAAQDKLALCVARALRLKHSAPSSSSSSASPTAAAAAGAVRRPATRRSTLANWVDADSHEQGQGQHARGERYDEDDDDDDDDELAGRLMLATHESTSPVELAQGPLALMSGITALLSGSASGSHAPPAAAHLATATATTAAVVAARSRSPGTTVGSSSTRTLVEAASAPLGARARRAPSDAKRRAEVGAMQHPAGTRQSSELARTRELPQASSTPATDLSGSLQASSGGPLAVARSRSPGTTVASSSTLIDAPATLASAPRSHGVPRPSYADTHVAHSTGDFDDDDDYDEEQEENCETEPSLSSSSRSSSAAGSPRATSARHDEIASDGGATQPSPPATPHSRLSTAQTASPSLATVLQRREGAMATPSSPPVTLTRIRERLRAASASEQRPSESSRASYSRTFSWPRRGSAVTESVSSTVARNSDGQQQWRPLITDTLASLIARQQQQPAVAPPFTERDFAFADDDELDAEPVRSLTPFPHDAPPRAPPVTAHVDAQGPVTFMPFVSPRTAHALSREELAWVRDTHRLVATRGQGPNVWATHVLHPIDSVSSIEGLFSPASSSLPSAATLSPLLRQQLAMLPPLQVTAEVAEEEQPSTTLSRGVSSASLTAQALRLLNEESRPEVAGQRSSESIEQDVQAWRQRLGGENEAEARTTRTPPSEPQLSSPTESAHSQEVLVYQAPATASLQSPITLRVAPEQQSRNSLESTPVKQTRMLRRTLDGSFSESIPSTSTGQSMPSLTQEQSPKKKQPELGFVPAPTSVQAFTSRREDTADRGLLRGLFTESEQPFSPSTSEPVDRAAMLRTLQRRRQPPYSRAPHSPEQRQEIKAKWKAGQSPESGKVYAETSYGRQRTVFDAQKQYLDKKRDIDALLATEPNNVEALERLAYLQLDQPIREVREEAARQTLQRVIEIGGQVSPDTYHTLGILEMRQGRAAVAFSLFKRAVDMRPENAMFNVSLGNAYLSQSPPQVCDAQDVLEIAVQVCPDCLTGWYSLGRLHEVFVRPPALRQALACYNELVRRWDAQEHEWLPPMEFMGAHEDLSGKHVVEAALARVQALALAQQEEEHLRSPEAQQEHMLSAEAVARLHRSSSFVDSPGLTDTFLARFAQMPAERRRTSELLSEPRARRASMSVGTQTHDELPTRSTKSGVLSGSASTTFSGPEAPSGGMRERHPSFCGGTGEQVHAQLEQLIASTSLQAGADDSSARSLAELREMWRTSAQLRKEQLELAKALLDQAKASAAQHDKLLDAAMSLLHSRSP